MAKDKETETTTTAADAPETAEDKHAVDQAKKVAEAVSGDVDPLVIGKDERAAKLRYDIQGGLGNHKEGTVIRHLSESAYITLVHGGGHDSVKAGTKVSEDAVDASAPVA